jgi:hypothetical protein
MASPDFKQYIDLTVNDLQPTDLYTAAADYARIALPEFEPRVGSVEDALLQAVSTVGAINLAAINRLPNGLMEGVLRLLGLERREASSSTVQVQFELLNAGSTVPANFTVVYEVVSNDQVFQYPFVLQSSVVASALSTTVAATLVCSVVGTIPTITVGTELELATTSSNVFSCTTTAIVAQGLDAETDIEFLNRGTTYLASLSRTLNTARQIESYILATYPEVGRCKVYDLVYSVSNITTPASSSISSDGTDVSLYTTITNQSAGNPYADIDPPSIWRVILPPFYGITETDGLNDPITEAWASGLFTGLEWDEFGEAEGGMGTISFTPANTFDSTTVEDVDFIEFILCNGLKKSTHDTYPVPGSFTVVILGQNGIPVSRDVKLAIYEDIVSRTTPGMLVSVISAFPYNIDIEVAVVLEAGYSGVTIEDEVKTLLEEYYSMESFPYWSDPIGYNQIASLAGSVTGVKSVHSVTATIPEYGTDGITRSIFNANDSSVSITAIGGVDYINPEFYGTLPSALVTVTSSTEIPA